MALGVLCKSFTKRCGLVFTVWCLVVSLSGTWMLGGYALCEFVCFFEVCSLRSSLILTPYIFLSPLKVRGFVNATTPCHVRNRSTLIMPIVADKSVGGVPMLRRIFRAVNKSALLRAGARDAVDWRLRGHRGWRMSLKLRHGLKHCASTARNRCSASRRGSQNW